MSFNLIVFLRLTRSLFCFFLAAQHAPDRLDDFIDTINSKLQPLFMQIRKGMSEDNGHQYYALVSVFSYWTYVVLFCFLISDYSKVTTFWLASGEEPVW